MLIQDGRYLAKRSDPIALPSASDISGVAVATNTAVTATGLSIDSGVAAGPTPNAPILTIIQTVSSSSATQSHAADAVSSGKSIPVSTVVGSCIGAFVFVSALIICGIWFYRRYAESLKRQALSRGSLKHRLQPDPQRRPWNKLEDEEDKWEGQTKEVDQVVPMEKLTMFKRAASVRTAYTHKSLDDHPLTYPQSFAPFDTNLVRTLSADIPQSQSEVVNPTKAHPSTFSSSSNSLGEPLSSSLNMAIPTPEATVLQSHKWESAEVVQYEGQSAEIVEPSTQPKRSMHNPFFGSQENNRARPDSPSDEKPVNAKGKGRMDSISSSLLSSDPFEVLAAQLPRPIHQATDSSASNQSKTRALQALMGALELSEDEVRDRLRVASMQPSEVSRYIPPFGEDVVKP